MRVVTYILSCLLIGLGLLLGGVAAIAYQGRAISSFRQIGGTVTRSDIRFDRLRGYRPVLEYHFVVNQRRHTGNRVTPLPGGLIVGPAEAKQWAAKFPVDHPVTVFVDPVNPNDSYLIRRTRFYPYVIMMLGAAVLGLGAMPLGAGGFFESGPRPHGGGLLQWYSLAESSSPMGRALGPLAVAVFWFLVATGVSLHYFLVIGPPFEWLSISIAVFVAGAVVAWVVGWRRGWAAVRFGECRAWSTLPEAHLDLPVVVKFEQKLPTQAQVRQARIGLHCLRHGGLTTQRLFAASADEPARLDAHLLFGEHKFEVPPKKRRPSSPFSRWSYPRIEWYVQLDATLASGHVCRRRFPIAARLGDGEA